MSTLFQARARIGVVLAAAVAIVSWAVALGEAAQRLAAGPLCSARQDAWTPLGHCPACFVAVAATLLSLTLWIRLRAADRPKPARLEVGRR